MKQTNKSSVGTSFHHSTINATVKQLKSILGEPTFVTNDGQDKVNFEWDMENNDEDVFTVYDWKNYRPISEDEVICWHIGGKAMYVTETALMEITEALKTELNETEASHIHSLTDKNN